MTTHIVQFSGGIGSWAATQRVVAEHGTDNLVLLVAETRVEDPDLWRFVRDSTVHIGVPPTVVADARTPSRCSPTNDLSAMVDWRHARRSSSNVPAGPWPAQRVSAADATPPAGRAQRIAVAQ
jgi:hypothetical protein